MKILLTVFIESYLFGNRLVEAEEKLDLALELNKIYKSIVKGVDTTDRAGAAMSAGPNTSKTSSPRLVSSNDR